MNVRHRQAGVLNAGQKGHVGNLFRGLITADVFDHTFVGINQPVNTHAFSVVLGNPPTAGVHLFQRPVITCLTHRSYPDLYGLLLLSDFLDSLTFQLFDLSDIHNHFRQPTIVRVFHFQPVIGDRLDFVIQFMPRSVNQFSATRCP